MLTQEDKQTLLKTLHECMTACNHCYNACLQEEDINMMKDCIRLDRECADFCAYLAQSISRGTPFTSELANVCVEICEACGKECQKHSHDHCQQCAKACFDCASACKKVA